MTNTANSLGEARDLRIFVASPGDVWQERDIVSNIVTPEIRRVFTYEDVEGLPRPRLSNVDAVRWETHTWPDVGIDAQDVINKQIGDFDVFVGIMWKRFGTPTKRGDSGTGEEFERAYNLQKKYGKPYLMFYFRTEPFYAESLSELSQFRKVLMFRQKLTNRGVYFFQYASPLEFERQVREHLMRRVFHSYGRIPVEGEVAAAGRGQEPKVLPYRKPGESTVAKRKIFLAYSREDLERVKHVYSLLRAAGYEPWLDVENLLPGQQWMQEIRRALESADIVLVFLSKASSGKRAGYLSKEIRIALEEWNKIAVGGPSYIIPVRLDPVEPLNEELMHIQWVDLFQEGGEVQLIKALGYALQEPRPSHA
jgi:hypothetical protein